MVSIGSDGSSLERMECCNRPGFNYELESLIARIHQPRVCIDNEKHEDCTLVKVDSPNKRGILLEMVQVLTDLDLIISKSYISSDGGWFMDVFHVTDQQGNKLTNESLINYIQQELCAGNRGGESMHTYLGSGVGHTHVPTELTALEVTGTDRPGLLSEISAILVELDCHVVAAEAWTHNRRAACIMYVADGVTGGAISDRERLAHMEDQLENVVGAHHLNDKERKRRVRLVGPSTSRIHPQRRLHQLMFAERDYDGKDKEEKGRRKKWKNGMVATEVSIESWKQKGYSVVSVRSQNRSKLLFDTVCALADMDYVVFHATISTHDSLAVQEYYIRHMDGCTLDSESERQRVTQCLAAAVERRVSQGLRLDVCTQNRLGLLSDITRVFRENGLSVSRLDITTSSDGERAIGTFYVTDASGNEVDLKTVESVRKEIGGGLTINVNRSSLSSPRPPLPPHTIKLSKQEQEETTWFSLGNLLWSQLKRIFSIFGFIRS